MRNQNSAEQHPTDAKSDTFYLPMPDPQTYHGDEGEKTDRDGDITHNNNYLSLVNFKKILRAIITSLLFENLSKRKKLNIHHIFLA